MLLVGKAFLIDAPLYPQVVRCGPQPGALVQQRLRLGFVQWECFRLPLHAQRGARHKARPRRCLWLHLLSGSVSLSNLEARSEDHGTGGEANPLPPQSLPPKVQGPVTGINSRRGRCHVPLKSHVSKEESSAP